MDDLYNIKAFLIKTSTRSTLDHEISSKKPLCFDFIAHPNSTNRIWTNFTVHRDPTIRNPHSTFGMSLLLGEKYRVKTKFYDFRSPKISLRSTLPLPNNTKYFIKLSPRHEERDNVFTSIGISEEIDKFKVTAAFLIQNSYHMLLKVGFYPWGGVFLTSCLNYDISNWRIADYAGMIGYERKNWEVFFRQTSQMKRLNDQEISSISLGCCYKYSPKLAFAMWLRSTQSKKETPSSKEKVVAGLHYKIDDKKSLKLKLCNDLSYSVFYKHDFKQNLGLAIRFTDNIKQHVSFRDKIGIHMKYQLV